MTALTRCDWIESRPNWGIGTSAKCYRCRLALGHEGFHQWESEPERQAFVDEFKRQAWEPFPWAS